MFAITVEYLGGVAYLNRQAYDEPGRAEWPPHPDRLFMAMVAAAYRGGPNPGEREALQWIAAAPPPGVAASASIDRPTLQAYWPTNDKLRGSRNKLKLVTATVPDDPRVSYVWSARPSPEVVACIADILERVTYLGSSEATVSCWVDDAPGAVTFAPDESGEQFLRTMHQGRLEELEQAYSAGFRPPPSLWTAYSGALAVEPQLSGEWGSMIPMALSQAVDPRGVVRLVDATRACVLSACKDPIPAWVSGHTEDGDRLRGSHLGFAPLSNVGHPNADGLVLGIGLLIPRGVSPIETNSALGEFVAGEHWVSRSTSLAKADISRKSTLAGTWTRRSTVWGTVTPITLHRWPRKSPVESLLLESLQHAGLPTPTHIEILHSSPHRGGLGIDVPNAPKRYRLHARIEWPRAVSGPVSIGAGRYKGLGFCRPI